MIPQFLFLMSYLQLSISESFFFLFSGLCYQNSILYDLWLFLCSLGPNCGMKAFLDHLAFNTKCSAPEFQMLQLFADCMAHYVT